MPRRVFGLDFANPVGLAAGWDKDGEALAGRIAVFTGGRLVVEALLLRHGLLARPKMPFTNVAGAVAGLAEVVGQRPGIVGQRNRVAVAARGRGVETGLQARARRWARDHGGETMSHRLQR